MKEKYKIGKMNEKAIEELLNKLKAKGLKESSVITNKRYLRMFFGRANKDFDKLTDKDIDKVIIEFKPNVAESVKMALRKFLKYHNLNQLAESIELTGKNMTKAVRGIESVLTPEEIKRLLKAPNNLRDKALIETFLVTGAELKAVQGLNIEDIEIKPEAIWVNIKYGKDTTEKRSRRKIPIVPNEDNPIALYPKNLVKWIQFRDAKPNEPLWISNSHQRLGKRLSKEGMADIIRSYKDTLENNKNLTPHIFRHTSATYDGERLNEAMMCQKYGWNIGSPMANRYCHFGEETLFNQMMEQAGLKKDDVKKGKVCPRCGEVNNINAEVCGKCQQILDTKTLIEQVKKQEEEKTAMQKRMLQMEADLHEMQEEKYWERQEDIVSFMNESIKAQIEVLDKQGIDTTKLKKLLKE